MEHSDRRASSAASHALAAPAMAPAPVTRRWPTVMTPENRSSPVAEGTSWPGREQISRELSALPPTMARLGLDRRPGPDALVPYMPPPRVGVSYRTDGLGTAHTGWDRASLQNAAAVPGATPMQARTLPEPLSALMYPPKPPPVPNQKRNETPEEATARQQAVAQRGQYLANVGNVNLHVADTRRATDIRETMRGVHGLMLTGAPSAVHSQRTQAMADPADALVNVPATPEAHTERNTRADFEHGLLAEARLRGMPVLAICAGSWRVAEAYGGFAETLPAVERGGHYRPGADTWRTQHPVAARGNTLVGGSFPPRERVRIEELDADDRVASTTSYLETDRRLSTVNSTHWATPAMNIDGELRAAPAPATPRLQALQEAAKLPRSPRELEVSALAPNPHGGLPTVEAFESRHGAPVIGIQWHPEGYLPGAPGRADAHPDTIAQAESLFRGFSQATRAYQGRQAVNQELLQRFRRE